MTTNPELELCLTKAISTFKVREMLTKFGVPEDAEVTLELYLGEDSQPAISCPIRTTVKKDHIQCGSISLTSFQHLVKDDFINPAIHTLDLGRLIPDDDRNFANGEKPMKVAFRSNSSSFSIGVVTILSCCQRYSDGSCCCAC